MSWIKVLKSLPIWFRLAREIYIVVDDSFGNNEREAKRFAEAVKDARQCKDMSGLNEIFDPPATR